MLQFCSDNVNIVFKNKIIDKMKPFSAGTDYSRHLLTSKGDPRTERVKKI